MEGAGESLKVPKIWRFNIENCDTSEVFKNKNYREILKENVWEFTWDGRALMPVQSRSHANSHSLLEFRGIFCF